jgi:hypothetical protein
MPEFGRLLADTGFTDMSVTADHRDDQEPGPGTTAGPSTPRGRADALRRYETAVPASFAWPQPTYP